MAIAITTKYFGPTNTKGSRVKVTSSFSSKFVAWDDALDAEENHALAAAVYIHEVNKCRAGDLGWTIVGGGSLPDESGYAFILDLVKKV